MKIHDITAGLLSLALCHCGVSQVPLFTNEGFKVPQPGSELFFPAANGAHPEYKIEWWYLTGHLYSDSGRRFGYQATFFRSGLKPATSMGTSPFGNQQVYLAHMALTDLENGRFLFAERLSRDGWDAYALQGGLSVRNGDWTLQASDTDPDRMNLGFSIRSEAVVDISLTPAKPVVRFGKDGTSRKGPAAEARSFYLSHTRLETTGTIRIDGATVDVRGSSWMDHEIASSQLDPSYTGWDWIAVQLKDGWEVKAYLLREADGSASPFSALIWISPDGDLTYRNSNEFEWNKGTFWTSPKTGYRYPNRPAIRTRHPLTGEPLGFFFQPVMNDQELALPGTSYWEGAGDILDTDGEHIGSAYLELVGYGGPIRGLQ